jgi:hypothetical protein
MRMQVKDTIRQREREVSRYTREMHRIRDKAKEMSSDAQRIHARMLVQKRSDQEKILVQLSSYQDLLARVRRAKRMVQDQELYTEGKSFFESILADLDEGVMTQTDMLIQQVDAIEEPSLEPRTMDDEQVEQVLEEWNGVRVSCLPIAPSGILPATLPGEEERTNIPPPKGE